MPSIALVRGSAQNPVFFLLDEQQNPIDLTGGNLKFAAKRSVSDPDSLKLFDLACVPDADQIANKGKYTMPFTSVQTLLAAGDYVANLRFWKSGVATSAPPTRAEAWTFSLLNAVVQTET